MKKAITFLLALALLLVPTSLSQAGEDFSKNKNEIRPQLKMTQEQKEKLIKLKIEQLELKKQIVKQNAENGTITQEHAKRIEEKLNKRLEQLKAGELGNGFHRKHSPQSNKS